MWASHNFSPKAVILNFFRVVVTEVRNFLTMNGPDPISHIIDHLLKSISELPSRNPPPHYIFHILKYFTVQSSSWDNHKQMWFMPQKVCKQLLWQCKWGDCYILIEGCQSFMLKISFKIKPGNILDFRRNRLVEHIPDRWTHVRTRPEKRRLCHV